MKNKFWALTLATGFALTLASCGGTTTSTTPATAIDTPTAQLANGHNMKKVVVYHIKGNAPVIGAKVFNNETNELIGVTNEDGILMVESGMELRVVEPLYGQYQSIIKAEDKAVISPQSDGAQKDGYYIGWPI